MPLVTKCCCCCSLKYGYLAYGVICLAFRICAITTILFLPAIFAGSDYYSRSSAYNAAQIMSGSYLGWFTATGLALFIALKGIVQRRSILLYPYIVVLIFEIIALIISCIIKIALISHWLSVLLELLIVGSIDIYAAICLISLYQHMKESEKKRPAPLETLALRTA